METPAVRIRYVGWKIAIGVSASPSSTPWASEYRSTQSVTAEDTVSISAESRSATRSMPTGAAQPPTSSTSGPSSTAKIRVTEETRTSDSATTLMTPCARP